MPKPFAPACERNQLPILAVLERLLPEGSVRDVLEIGSGTGQHAVFFAEKLPHLVWQTSDRVEQHRGIQVWLDEAKLPNARSPLALDVAADPWPEGPIDAVFSANTAHIMSWPAVQSFIRGVGGVLASGGLLLLYGPFNYGGRYTSDSNTRFDVWLEEQDPESAIRDFEDMDAEATAAGLARVEDNEMPANNRLLVWRKA
jgi:cyclopropane fatty-acyl-phospholipid synthase-like methyltransferase